MKTLHEWLDYIATVHPATMELGLERVGRVAEKLNLLPPAYSVITIAGTNGKGTTAALLELAYRDAGYQTALFTSPHLLRFNERIMVYGKMAQDRDIMDALAVVDATRGDESLTFFEFTVLAALLIFRDLPLDVVILEVGLGGRLDAVNVIDPDVAVITTIDLDHTDVLGEDREAIGYEKAGIFRPLKPAICGDLNCPESIQEHAQQIGAPLYCQGIDYAVEVHQDEWSWKSALYDYHHLPMPHIPLQNASTALMVLNAMRDERPVNIEHFKQALTELYVPGRFQVIDQHCPVILDVAHNVEAAMMLADNLNQTPCRGKTFAVFSSLRDKDTAGMVAVLKSMFDYWFVAPLSVERAQPLEVLEGHCHDLPVNFYHSIREAYRAAMLVATPQDRVVVCGSFYVLADVLQEMQAECDAN